MVLTNEQRKDLSVQLSSAYQYTMPNMRLKQAVDMELIQRGFLLERLSWLEYRAYYLRFSIAELKLITAVFDKNALTSNLFKVFSNVATQKRDMYIISKEDISYDGVYLTNCKYIGKDLIMGEIEICSLERALRDNIIKSIVPLDDEGGMFDYTHIDIKEFAYIKIYYADKKAVPMVANNMLILESGAYIDIESVASYVVMRNTLSDITNIPVVVAAPRKRPESMNEKAVRDIIQKIKTDLLAYNFDNFALLKDDMSLYKVFDNLYIEYNYDKIIQAVYLVLSQVNKPFQSQIAFLKQVESKIQEVN